MTTSAYVVLEWYENPFTLVPVWRGTLYAEGAVRWMSEGGEARPLERKARDFATYAHLRITSVETRRRPTPPSPPESA